MPVYTISAKDLNELRTGERCAQYSFLGSNHTKDHGDYLTITLSHRSRNMLVDKYGFVLDFYSELDHDKGSTPPGLA